MLTYQTPSIIFSRRKTKLLLFVLVCKTVNLEHYVKFSNKLGIIFSR